MSVLKDYDISVHHPPCKSSVVGYDLMSLSMSKVTHVEEDIKELAKEVHMLSPFGVIFMLT